MTHSPSRGHHAGMPPEDEGNEYDINDRFISHDNLLLRKHAQLATEKDQEFQQGKEMFMQMVTKISTLDDYAQKIYRRDTGMFENASTEMSKTNVKLQDLEEREIHNIGPNGIQSTF